MSKELAIQMVYLFMGAEPSIEDGCWEYQNGGHIELMQDLVDYAQLVVDDLSHRYDADFPGVYEYEVTEEFGGWIGAFVQRTSYLPTLDEAKAELTKIANEFFSQGDK